MHASVGQYSPEIDMLGRIDRFGVNAVMGRPVLYFGEARRMIAAENVVKLYRQRQEARKADREVEWYAANEKAADWLLEIEKRCRELNP